MVFTSLLNPRKSLRTRIALAISVVSIVAIVLVVITLCVIFVHLVSSSGNASLFSNKSLLTARRNHAIEYLPHIPHATTYFWESTSILGTVFVVVFIISVIIADRLFLPLTRFVNSIRNFDETSTLIGFSSIQNDCELGVISEFATQMIERMNDREEKFRQLLEGSLQGIVIVDIDDKISFVNTSFVTLIGCSVHEMVGKSVFALRLEDETSDERFKRALEQHGHADQFEISIRHPSGDIKWCMASVSPLFNSHNTYQGSFLMLVDITERKETETALSSAYNRQLLLNDIGDRLRGSNDVGDIQYAAVSLLGNALKAQRCIFMIADSTSDLVKVESQWYAEGLKAYPDTFDFRRMRLTSEGLFPKRTTLVVRDLNERSLSREMDATLRRYDLRSLVIVPLYDRDRLVAALAVYRQQAPYDWPVEEVELIELVATHVRSAVDAARLAFREHRIATVLQNALQPIMAVNVPDLDVATYYKPALDEASIGGDFFDIFEVRDGQYAFIMADVSGKGLGAAVEVATVRNMLRYLLYEGVAVAEAAYRLNNVLVDYHLLSGFVTLFISIYNSESRCFEYVSCGHEPLLLLEKYQQKIIQLDATGIPLGIERLSSYEQRSFKTQAGDTFLLYTDGFSDASQDRVRFLGTDGMARMLIEYAPISANAYSLRNRIVANAERFAGGALRDDACIIAVCVK